MNDNFRTGICKGAAMELVVCADLLSKGFDVYRAVAGNSLCDVIATIGGRILRIEVKSSPTYSIRDGVDLVAWLDATKHVHYHGRIEFLVAESRAVETPTSVTEQYDVSSLKGWISKADAAKRLGVSTKTIEKYVQRGILRQVIGKRTGAPDLAMIDPETIKRRESQRTPDRLGHVIDFCPTCPTPLPTTTG